MRLETFFSKIFLVNLARRKDRLDESLIEFDRMGLAPYVERFEACDNPENGNEACVRSHRKLIRQIAESNWDRVLIFEDDVAAITPEVLSNAGFKPDSQVWKTYISVPDGSANDRFDWLSGWLPEKHDVLYCGAGYGEPPISRYSQHVIRCAGMKTTGSYGITREFAKVWTAKVDALFANNPDRIGAIDDIFSMFARDHLYYVFHPRLFYQRESKSDLNGETHSRLYDMSDPVHENMV